jgi:hypothetical protein
MPLGFDRVESIRGLCKAYEMQRSVLDPSVLDPLFWGRLGELLAVQAQKLHKEPGDLVRAWGEDLP